MQKLKSAFEELDQFLTTYDLSVIYNIKQKQVDNLKKKCLDVANKLHIIRTTKAKELESVIIKQTEDLMLNNVQFKVNIDKVDL